ncbi:hypothetical protein LRP52_40425 [Photobacterium sp. ZSDE20]|uniref:Uncharacterized protein n=1 Tax=Photobacterium pectinilyticum TaxID=2906793 RepID=A0ABT1N7P9_9GAMM|nr:hypothetical protein [Photobacterium sp. ZSDE20]MCQ1060760.1 hypothetical protein [Photobacterium sp. ZSDE20]MDD1828449.1 hypothetical protein [Photobacterium sp. ZSDE20]
MSKTDLVYQCEVAGRRFEARIGYRGLMIFEDSRGSHAAEIGNAIVVFLPTDNGIGRNKRGFHLCRYDDEHKIDLTDLSPSELSKFIINFGIPIELEDECFIGNYMDYFVNSPCQLATKEWVKKHPRLAKRATYHIDRLTLADYAARELHCPDVMLSPTRVMTKLT